MHPFDRVVLIFNPASTGNASGLAAELSDELARRQPDLPVMLRQTEHAGHAQGGKGSSKEALTAMRAFAQLRPFDADPGRR